MSEETVVSERGRRRRRRVSVKSATTTTSSTLVRTQRTIIYILCVNEIVDLTICDETRSKTNKQEEQRRRKTRTKAVWVSAIVKHLKRNWCRSDRDTSLFAHIHRHFFPGRILRITIRSFVYYNRVRNCNYAVTANPVVTHTQPRQECGIRSVYADTHMPERTNCRCVSCTRLV